MTELKCSLLSCLTMNQLTFICCSLLLMNFILCVILIWMYRRKQQLSQQHQYKPSQNKNLHSQQLSDSLRCSMSTASTPQEINERQQQSIYYNEFGTYLEYEDHHEFEQTVKSTTSPKCMVSAISQTNPELSHYQTKRCVCRTVMENSSKQLTDEENLSLPGKHSVTFMKNCRQHPVLERSIHRSDVGNSNI
ncbi:unnamed protein product [Heterobilharzia americana]|nr:unnamed protein product [Heterobilharzia americana]CAH8642984.1 unnamed protein product [Heterobilharzia americana]